MEIIPTNQPDPIVINGIDLKIDPNVQKICETYNASSGATRSVLYIALVASIVGFIAVCNSSWTFNWLADRKDQVQNYIDISYQKYDGMIADSICRHDSLKSIDSAILVAQKNLTTAAASGKADLLKSLDGLKEARIKYRFELRDDKVRLRKIADNIAFDKNLQSTLVHSDIENNNTINISLIGVKIDINDLAPIFGLFLMVVLFILRFTSLREKNNLRIALISISERYPSSANFKTLKTYYEEEFGEQKYDDAYWNQLIQKINLTRRKYHYNFLSMNEVFNLPYLDSSENGLQKKIVGRAINLYLFYFFIIVYSYILLNDFCSIADGLDINPDHTAFIFLLSMIFYLLAFRFCESCIIQKKHVNILFYNFREDGYLYNMAKDTVPKRKSIIYSIAFLLIIIALSALINHVFPSQRLSGLLNNTVNKFLKFIK